MRRVTQTSQQQTFTKLFVHTNGIHALVGVGATEILYLFHLSRHFPD
jgi:hypothetical protein